MRLRSALAGLACLLMAAPAAAWDDQGHMMVAAVAYDHLVPATRTRIAQLLALSAYPTNGINNAGQRDADKAVFMMAATAVDAIKRSPDFVNDGEDPTKAQHATDNVGFSDRAMHRYWHYIDIPFSPDGTPLVQPQAVNARERIALFRKTLASNAPDPLKAYDLVWLIHLVGDVHQPLHATSRFTHAVPKGDRGGNATKLCASPCRDELHAFWDQVAGRNETISASIRAAHLLPPPDAAKAVITDESIWVQESFEIARTVVYAAPVGTGTGP